MTGAEPPENGVNFSPNFGNSLPIQTFGQVCSSIKNLVIALITVTHRGARCASMAHNGSQSEFHVVVRVVSGLLELVKFLLESISSRNCKHKLQVLYFHNTCSEKVSASGAKPSKLPYLGLCCWTHLGLPDPNVCYNAISLQTYIRCLD